MVDYEIVIIGAGIGGLVCGCYLARAGLKVLIVEQRSKPGGYCTEFEKGGYRFDAGVHSLGSLREEGVNFQILRDLELSDRISFITVDPTDRIITPDKTVFIRRDKDKTKGELIAHFPKERANIDNFFEFLLDNDFLSIVSKTKKITFKKLLDNFFSDYKLKAVLSILLGNLGLSSSQASALVCISLYREFILDGGYYPKGGIQVFPNLLASKFKEYGGTLLLSVKAVKVETKQKKIYGIKLNNGEFILTKFVVSNADATLTFCRLLDCKSEEAEKVKRLKPSSSGFIVFLGLNRKLNIKPKHFATWFFSTYDIDKCYRTTFDFSKIDYQDYFICSFPSLIDSTLAPDGKSIVRIFKVGVAYADKSIWDKYREILYQKTIEKVNCLIPGLQNYIEVKEIATPHTFFKFTSNRNGAWLGWASIPKQVDINVCPAETSIENLYLTGHWATNGIGQSGIPMVALSGKLTAQLIIRKYSKIK